MHRNWAMMGEVYFVYLMRYPLCQSLECMFECIVIYFRSPGGDSTARCHSQFILFIVILRFLLAGLDKLEFIDNVWCLRSDAWCLMFDVWCLMLDVCRVILRHSTLQTQPFQLFNVIYLPIKYIKYSIHHECFILFNSSDKYSKNYLFHFHYCFHNDRLLLLMMMMMMIKWLKKIKLKLK